MKTIRIPALLAALLALGSCAQQTSPTPQPPTSARTLGVYELNVNGVGGPSAAIQSTVRSVSGGLGAQASEISGLKFTLHSSSSVADLTQGILHLTTSYTVTNNTGTAISLPTYVPVDTAGAYVTDGQTPFRKVVTRKGLPIAPAGISLERSHYLFNNVVQENPSTSAFVSNLDTGALQLILPASTTAPGISHQGWQTASLAPGASQVVDFAMRIKLQGSDVGDNDPFRFSLVFAVADNPGTLALTNIASVQGSTPSGDAAAALTGSQTVEGVVTADYRTGTQQGFYLQEEGMDADGNVDTSDGIFVYCGASCGTVVGSNVSVGDRVRVTGTVSEFVTVSQFDVRSGTVTLLSEQSSVPDAVPLTLPLDFSLRERFEGMRVSVSGTVTNNFPLGRGASFDIADARLPQFTQVNAPSVSGNAAYLASLRNRFIRVDDGSRAQNPDPEIFARGGQVLSAANTLRAGDTATVTGVLSYGNDGWTSGTSGSIDTYRIHAAQTDVNVTPTNARLSVPEGVGGTLRVGSMNVLNFFTTLVTTNTGCTPNGTDSANSRGANNCEEFLRQRTKTVKAIAALNPDVLGMLEIQNDFDKGTNSSIANLVNALNAEVGAGTYAYINPGAKVGTDVISVAMIYKPGAVTPVGTLAKLDNTFDPNYIDTCSRPTLAQTFQSNANGGRFTAVMMHLKSKGSACAALGDADIGDGQGNAWKAREQAAQVIVNWLATNPTGVTEDDRILMGDYNAYEMETPLSILASGGYQNLFTSDYYSYQFDGQWGSLDHAVASASLVSQVTGKTKWHINSDEPTVLDYNTEFKTAGQITSYYAADQFRNSDHDPVLVGLSLTAQTPITPPPPSPSTALSADPNTFNGTTAGGSFSSTLTASTLNYTGGNLTVTTSGPSGWTITAPASTAPNSTFNVSITVPAGTAAGGYPVTIGTAGDGGTPTASTTITVNVTPVATTGTPWINELHYDNAGTDTGEFVEIVVPSGVNVADLSLVLYNGNGGASYATYAGSTFTAGATPTGYALYTVNVPATPGIQNGAPDGVALCKTDGTLVQFISYEGVMTATNGCANGVTSTDIGVSETGATTEPAGLSLRLSGTGNKYSDFTWNAPATATPGAVNTGQTLN